MSGLLSVTDVLKTCAIESQQDGWQQLSAHIDRCLMSQFTPLQMVASDNNTTDIESLRVISVLCQEYLHPVHFSHTFLPQLRSPIGDEIAHAQYLSHFGGHVPYIGEDGAWPTCPNAQNHDVEDDSIKQSSSVKSGKFKPKPYVYREAAPMILFFQLRICDFPPALYGVMCPKGFRGNDLFQFFMCPYDCYFYPRGDKVNSWLCRWQRVTETVPLAVPAVIVNEVSDGCEVSVSHNYFNAMSDNHEASVSSNSIDEASNPVTRSLSLLSNWIQASDLPTIFEDWPRDKHLESSDKSSALSPEWISSLWKTRWHFRRTAHHCGEKLSAGPLLFRMHIDRK